MQDIAKRCGVSHTTVSFVLRGREMGISETTRQKVLYEAICLDYQTRADQRIDSGKIRVDRTQVCSVDDPDCEACQ